jgi:hypothetical protein
VWVTAPTWKLQAAYMPGRRGRSRRRLVGARRPTVSIALGELTKRGELARSGDDWILKGERVAA